MSKLSTGGFITLPGGFGTFEEVRFFSSLVFGSDVDLTDDSTRFSFSFLPTPLSLPRSRFPSRLRLLFGGVPGHGNDHLVPTRYPRNSQTYRRSFRGRVLQAFEGTV